MKQSLAIAYSAKRKNMSRGGLAKEANESPTGMKGCPDCYDMGGECPVHYSEGGEVDAEAPLKEHSVVDEPENEKRHPEHEASKLDLVPEGMDSEDASDMEEDLPKLSKELSLSGEIMLDRKRKMMAKGGMASNEDELNADAEPLAEKRMDLEPVHTMSDPEHDQSSPSLDDEELVSQIIRERKRRRFE